MEKLRVRHLGVDKLKPWGGNPRRNEEAVGSVASSIERFGFNVPILCDEELAIIAGHTRWRAAVNLGMSKVPVIVLPLRAPDRKAFAIADNRTSQIAEWDFEQLGRVLCELRDSEAGLEGLGFSDGELTALMTPETEVDWRDMDKYLQEAVEKQFVLYQVKVRPADKNAIKERVAQFSEQHQLRHKDGAVTAGRVLCLLLGVEE